MKQLFAITFLFSAFAVTTFAQDSTVMDKAEIRFINLDTTYDFGYVPSQSTVQYRFEFKNTGKGNLVITNVHSELPYVKIQWPNKPVKHGKKGLIIVSVSPVEIGTFKDDLLVTSNATDSPYPFLHISGAIIPEGDQGTNGSSSAPKGGRRGR